MKVKELISILQTLDQEKEVKVVDTDPHCGDEWAEDITVVKHYNELGYRAPNGLINDKEQDCYIIKS